MKRWSIPILALILVGLTGCGSSSKTATAPAVPTGEQGARELDRAVQVSGQYLLYLPENYEDQESWPLMLFLHGAGERGDDLNLVKVHGPPKLIEEGKHFPFIVVSPQVPAGEWWKTPFLDALLDEVIEQYNVDEDRIYVTGLSMGGFGTWELAMHYPNRFAAIAPICGGGNAFLACALRDVPIWNFHGEDDQVVPLDQSQAMVDALQRCNGNVRFTIYPETGHDSWTETYDNPELYEWFLKHKREPTN